MLHLSVLWLLWGENGCKTLIQCHGRRPGTEQFVCSNCYSPSLGRFHSALSKQGPHETRNVSITGLYYHPSPVSEEDVQYWHSAVHLSVCSCLSFMAFIGGANEKAFATSFQKGVHFHKGTRCISHCDGAWAQSSFCFQLMGPHVTNKCEVDTLTCTVLVTLGF